MKFGGSSCLFDFNLKNIYIDSNLGSETQFSKKKRRGKYEEEEEEEP